MRLGYPTFQDLRRHFEEQFGKNNVHVLGYVPNVWGLLEIINTTSGGYSIRIVECLCLNIHTYQDNEKCWVGISWTKEQLDLHQTDTLGHYNALQLNFDREVDCVL